MENFIKKIIRDSPLQLLNSSMIFSKFLKETKTLDKINFYSQLYIKSNHVVFFLKLKTDTYRIIRTMQKLNVAEDKFSSQNFTTA